MLQNYPEINCHKLPICSIWFSFSFHFSKQHDLCLEAQVRQQHGMAPLAAAQIQGPWRRTRRGRNQVPPLRLAVAVRL
jgi:hypothetical protein